ncbi:hypothetical protein ACFW04_006599 [Cataglyphis niger]
MVAPTFVHLQGFIIGKNFIVKEVAVLRNGYILSHYIFASRVVWRMLKESERSQVSWLIKHHHGKMETFHTVWLNKEEDSSIVYVKGREKREWVTDILGDDAKNDVIIETLDTDYEDITSLNKLDVTNTMRCEKHLKNCIEIPSFINIEHRQMIRTLRRHKRGIRECYVWEDNEDGFHLELRRLFKLVYNEKDAVEELWDEPPTKRLKK